MLLCLRIPVPEPRDREVESSLVQDDNKILELTHRLFLRKSSDVRPVPGEALLRRRFFPAACWAAVREGNMEK